MYELIKLSNGLKVAIEHIPYVNSISIGLWVENGSRNEKESNNGISHFIEHMLFKGTETRNSKELAEVIEDVGGQINAFTAKEATCFYVKALDTHIDLGLDLLSDMLFNSKFTEEDIEKEKKVVIEEIKMSEDNPEDVLSDLHTVAIFGKDSISMPILGTEDTVNSFTREDIIEYMSRYYVPENSVISICGNFHKNDIYKRVEKYFGNWESKKGIKSQYTTPKLMKDFLFKEKDIEQVQFSLGLKGLPMGHEDNYALILLTNLFGGGASSKLFQNIRENLGLCYSIYAYPGSLVNTGMITIYSALNSTFMSEAYNEIEGEVFKFSKEKLSNEKLGKAKEQLKGNYILGLESTSSRMFSNGKSALIFNRIKKPQEIIDKIDSIDFETVNRVLKETYGEGILNGAFVGKDYELVEKSLKLNIKSV